MSSVWPFNARTSAPVLASHTRAAPVFASHDFGTGPALAVTTRDPSGLKDADGIELESPAMVRIVAPVLASQTRAVRSRLAVTTRDPSGLNDADRTKLV